MLKWQQIYGLAFLLMFYLEIGYAVQTDPTIHNIQDGSKRPIIRKISIITLDIFDTTDTKYKKFPFPLINKIHFDTKDHVIKRELLFKEGEPFETDLLEESIRNIRALPFFDEIETKIQPVSSDTIDIEIYIVEQWTTILGTKYAIQANQHNYGLYIMDYNLFGFGQAVKFSWAKTVEGIQKEFYFSENRVLNSHLQFTYHLKNYAAGRSNFISIGRPFYSIRSKMSFEFNYNNYHGWQGVYENENKLSSFHLSETDFNSRLSYLIFRQGLQSARLSFVYYINQIDLSDFLPAPTQHLSELPAENQTFGAGIDWIKLLYQKTQFIDKFEVIEDISLGRLISFYVGKSVEVQNGRHDKLYFYGKLAKSRFLFNRLYLFGQYEGYTYRDQNFKQFVNTVKFKSFIGLPAKNLLAINGEFISSRNIPIQKQLFLGENQGLRGFKTYFKTGQNRIVFNFEERFYSKINFYSLRLGTALFIDTGYIWDNTEVFKDQSPFTAIGFGFRFGTPKANNASMIRIDFAWRFHSGPGLSVSLGKNHFFSAYEPLNLVSVFPQKFGEVKQ